MNMDPDPAFPSDALSPTAQRILDYLRDHPLAQDSMEGIAEWWLLERKIREAAADVGKALSELAARGLISERKRLNETVYGLEPPSA